MLHRSKAVLGALTLATSLLVVAAPTAAQAADKPPAPTADDTTPQGVDVAKRRPTIGGVSTKAVQNFSYAGAHQFIGNGARGVGADGAVVETSVSKPFLDTTKDAHSLFEMTAQSNDQKQIIEVGWTVDPAVCKSIESSPCLFVFHWVNGVKTCYNGCGWVDYAPTKLNAGDALPYTKIGAMPTIFYSMLIQNTGSAWWVGFTEATNDTTQWIGYFPFELWTAADPPVTFDKIQLVQAFGEIAAKSSSYTTPCSDMGSGIFGTGVEKNAAMRVTHYGLITPPADTVGDWKDTVEVTPSSLTPNAYRATAVDGKAFQYGGPGFSADGSTTGTVGKC